MVQKPRICAKLISKLRRKQKVRLLDLHLPDAIIAPLCLPKIGLVETFSCMAAPGWPPQDSTR